MSLFGFLVCLCVCFCFCQENWLLNIHQGASNLYYTSNNVHVLKKKKIFHLYNFPVLYHSVSASGCCHFRIYMSINSFHHRQRKKERKPCFAPLNNNTSGPHIREAISYLSWLSFDILKPNCNFYRYSKESHGRFWTSRVDF